MRSLDTLEAVAAGQLSPAEGAVRLGITEESLHRKLEVLELARALSQRDAGVAKASRVRSVVAALVVLTLSSTVWLTRNAWAATCTQTLPAPMVTFCPDNPAVASQVNGNFQQLVTWITAKTGTITDANLTAQAVSAQSVTSVGPVRAMASNATSGLNLTWNKSGSTGETDFQNLPGSGAGGFAFYNNNTQLGSLDSAGNLTINGSLIIGSNGTMGTSTNSRRPVFTASANCATSGTCTVNCAPGVVKLALGFHGANYNALVTQSAWACGTAIAWLGQCIGSQSCTVTTGCGSSAIYAECW